MKNKDDNTLRWALQLAPFHVAHEKHAYYHLDFTKIEASTTISQTKWDKRQNNLALNVFGRNKGGTN